MREPMQYMICWVLESWCLNRTPAFKQSVLCSFFVLRACAFQHVDCRHYEIADCRIVEWDTIQHLWHLSIAMRDLMREGFYSKHSTCYNVRRLLTHSTSAVPWHHLRLREPYSPLVSIKSTYPPIPQPSHPPIP